MCSHSPPESIRKSRSSELFPQTPASALIIQAPLTLLYKERGIMGGVSASRCLIKTYARQWFIKGWQIRGMSAFLMGGCLICIFVCVPSDTRLCTQCCSHERHTHTQTHARALHMLLNELIRPSHNQNNADVLHTCDPNTQKYSHIKYSRAVGAKMTKSK